MRDGSVDPEDWREYLVAEPVKVRKTSFALSEREDKSAVYAYWVGDEGVKAKLNLLASGIKSGCWSHLNVDSDSICGFLMPKRNPNSSH